MTSIQRSGLSCALAASVGGAARADAQTLDFLSNDTPIGPIVTGAPYSGEGVTTLKLKLFDGTRIERKVTARFYRDSAGRIRREQTIVGSGGAESVGRVADGGDDRRPVAGVIYALNPGSRTAHRIAIDKRMLAGEPPPPPPPPPRRPGERSARERRRHRRPHRRTRRRWAAGRSRG